MPAKSQAAEKNFFTSVTYPIIKEKHAAELVLTVKLVYL